ncbi:hypothetical protein [Streptomyces sp. NPDC055105]|uniref:hypothetical protein n=1 Tax=Streptomyces sp. NPDC055105 TaxID=3365719 RepID=UPI0037D4C242
MATTNRFDGCAKELIPTALGLINARISSRPDCPAAVCWPSLKMDAPCGGTSTSTSPWPGAMTGRTPRLVR